MAELWCSVCNQMTRLLIVDDAHLCCEQCGKVGVQYESDDTEEQEVDEKSNKSVNKSESLSDIDDNEVKGYVHNDEEKRYKKIIWEELNKEYLEQQAVKEADVAAAKKAFEVTFCGCPEELQAAWELVEASKARVTKSKKERQRKNATKVRNLGLAQTAVETTHQMPTKKRRSSKINYDALEKISDENVVDNLKRSRVESPAHENEFDEPDDEYEIEDQLVDKAEGVEDEYANFTYEEEGYYYDEEY